MIVLFKLMLLLTKVILEDQCLTWKENAVVFVKFSCLNEFPLRQFFSNEISNDPCKNTRNKCEHKKDW